VNDDHRTVREQLGAYALDHLDHRERLALDAHLAGCPACRAELAEITPAARGLALVDPTRLGAPAPAPPPELGDRIAAAVTAERRPARHTPRWLAPAAAAVVAVALGAGVGWWAHPDAPAAAPLESVAVSTPGTGVTASAELVPHTWGVEIQLTASGLRPGQRYLVAITDSADQRLSAGEFIGTGPTVMHCNLNSSVLRQSARGFEVTDTTGALVMAARF